MPCRRGNPTEIAPGVVGDGVYDDTTGLQALLDSGASEIHFPSPPVCLLISKTLKIHSGQALTFGRYAIIRLKDHADAVMITNADHEEEIGTFPSPAASGT